MKRIPVLATLTSLMLSATFAASLIATHLSPMAPVVSLDSIPMTLGAWAGFPSPQLPDRNVELLAATSILGRGYHKPGRQLDLFIAYYALQRPGASWHTPRNCLPSAGWEISKYDSAAVAFGGWPQRINKLSVQHDGEKLLVLYWYQTRDRIIANEYQGRVFLVWDAITKGHTAAAIIRLVVPDEPGASEDALAFGADIMSAMQTRFTQ